MSSPLDAFRQALAANVAQGLGLPDDLIVELVGQMRIPDPGHGDLALPCFSFAKRAKKNPADVAAQVVGFLRADPNSATRWARVEAKGAYVNVRFADSALYEAVVPEAQRRGFGTCTLGRGKTVVIDFSAPNIAKPLAFHHIRSTVIGAALGRIHETCGFRVIGINYLGDWGKQFGLLATGFARHGDPTKRSDAKHLVEVYVKANREADVATYRETVARPAEVRALVERIRAARDELRRQEPQNGGDERGKGGEREGEGEGVDSKKREKNLRSLEKKLLAMRGTEVDAAPTGTEQPIPVPIPASVDPMDGVEEFLRTVEEAAKVAGGALAQAEERDREARLFLKRMEEGDPSALAEWREFRSASVAEFQRIYERMGITFTHWEGEAKYQGVLEDTIARVRSRPGTEMSDGAEIVSMPRKGGEPPVLLKTRDGTTLYVTRDIAAAIDRFERFAFDRALYVVAQDQSLHFEQLFRTLSSMGMAWADRCQHVKFGRIYGMSTRRGQVVFLDEVLDESVAKAREICAQSARIDPANIDRVVESIGIGAVVFGDLRNPRISDYRFDWNEVLDFSGHTGPYVQYTHARASSILRKAGGTPPHANLDHLRLEEERAIVVALARYPDAVREACVECEPSIVTRSLIDLAEATAHYLTAGNRDREKRVLVDDPDVRGARLHLVDAIRETLASGLRLLGLDAPEAM